MPLFEDDTLEGAIRKATVGLRPKQYAKFAVNQAIPVKQVGLPRGSELQGDQLQRVLNAVGRASDALNTAAHHLRTNRRDELFNLFFGMDSQSQESDVDNVQRDIDAVRDEAQSLNENRVMYLSQCPGNENAEYLPNRMIAFCQNFFGELRSANARTVIHECTHLRTSRRHFGNDRATVIDVARRNSRDAMASIGNLVWYVWEAGG